MPQLNRLSDTLIEQVLALANASARRRANFNFHSESDTLQRMLNVMLRGTYCAPHKHQEPDKLEIFTALRGEVAIARFDDEGRLLEAVRISQHGPIRQVEIPPRTWHTVVVLSPEAVLYEVIEGMYDPATHKRFAPFAPGEKNPAAAEYLRDLEERVRLLSTQTA